MLSLWFSLDTDDNDEDGDESGFPELLEAAKKEDEVKKAERIKIGKTVVAGGDAVESAGAAKADEKAEEGTAVGPLSMGAVDEEDALVSAMQSASISGSRISDMPTP